MGLPLIIHTDGTIYFYKKMAAEEKEIEISNYLKKTTVQIHYTDKLEVYKIEDYSIVSLILMDINGIDKFISYLYELGYNEIPPALLEHIKAVQESMKVVSLTLGKAEIIIKIMKGDLSFLERDKKMGEKLKHGKEQNSYTYPRKDNFKLIEYLANKNVNMTFPSIDMDGTIDFNFKEKIIPRYYQDQAFDALVNREKGLVVMPVGSGKTYVAMRLIQYFKKVTLILCENKYNCFRWKNMLLKYFNISNEDISVCVDESNVNKISKINICSYDIIRSSTDESIFQRLFDNKWGLIIYDNAHKVVTEKAADLLYLKTTYKFAFDSTLNRSDGMERSLLNLFGGITYNISSHELVNNLFQKRLDCYKVDLRKLSISKIEFIRHMLKQMKEKSILVVAFRRDDMKRIYDNTGIKVINAHTSNDERIQLVQDFNSSKIKRLCIGNLIEKYPITNVDAMIAAGYRGGTEIEDNFRIGTLVSTPSKLFKLTITQMFYLINNDIEKEKVRSKEIYLNNHNIFLKELSESKHLGDEISELER